MASYQFSADDYLAAFVALLPRGRVWSRDSDTVLASVVRGLVQAYVRTNGRALQLLADAFPPSAYELLPEWEAALGLPDACTGTLPTVAQRQAAVAAKFATSGGQSLPYFIALAQALGYVITITEFTEWSFDSNDDEPLNGPDWAFAWQVNAPLNTIFEWTFDSDDDEPFASWGNQLLECVIDDSVPAHTTVLFAYV